MTTMVVQAHPVEDSFNTALLGAVTRGLETTGTQFAVRRLWQHGFVPPNELAGVERLVIVFPTWLGGPPSLLLDWLQQMLAASAFGTVTSLTAVTTHGSSRLTNMVQGEWGRRYLAGRVVPTCRPGTRLDWHALYKIDRRAPAEIVGFLTATEQRFARVSPAA